MLGVLNDMWMREVTDIGMAGPDGGQGGSYLVLPPGYQGEVPDGYFVVRPRTYGVWLALRAFRTPEGEAGPAVATHKRIRIYPLARKDDVPEMIFVNAAGRALDTIHPGDSRYFDDLAQLIAEEHEEAIDAETAGMLAAIGIAKGEPFASDERMQRIFAEAATVGSFIAMATSYKSRLPLQRYDDRQWIELAKRTIRTISSAITSCSTG